MLPVALLCFQLYVRACLARSGEIRSIFIFIFVITHDQWWGRGDSSPPLMLKIGDFWITLHKPRIQCIFWKFSLIFHKTRPNCEIIPFSLSLLFSPEYQFLLLRTLYWPPPSPPLYALSTNAQSIPFPESNFWGYYFLYCTIPPLEKSWRPCVSKITNVGFFQDLYQ